MNTITALKIVGIVDGVLLASIAAIGHFAPTTAPICNLLVIILGAVGTGLSSIAALLGPSS